MSERRSVLLMSACLSLCWGLLAAGLLDWQAARYCLIVSPPIGIAAGAVTRRLRLYQGVRPIFAGLVLLYIATALFALGTGALAIAMSPRHGGDLFASVYFFCFGASLYLWLLWPLASISTYLIGWAIRHSTAG